VSRHGNSPNSRWLPLHAVLVFGFLYLPIVTLVVYSFNGEGVGGFPPHHLTLDWYRTLFGDDAIWGSVVNSLEVAVGAMAISLAFGIPAALALDRADFPGKSLFRRLVLLPLILPGIITGLSLLMLFREADVKLSLLTITLGHGTALISVATTEVFAGLQKLDRAQEEASLDLGANYWQTFWHVTLPNLRLSIIGAALLIFTRNCCELLPHRPRQHPAAGNLGPPAPRNHSGDQRHLHHHLCVLPGGDRSLVPLAHEGRGRSRGRSRAGVDATEPRLRWQITFALSSRAKPRTPCKRGPPLAPPATLRDTARMPGKAARAGCGHDMPLICHR